MNSGWWDCEASARGIRWKAVHGDCKPFPKTPMPRAWQLDGRHWLDTEELLIGSGLRRPSGGHMANITKSYHLLDFWGVSGQDQQSPSRPSCIILTRFLHEA